MPEEISPGDFVVLLGDRELRKVLDVRVYVRDDGYRERVFRVQGVSFWVPEGRLRKVRGFGENS